MQPLANGAHLCPDPRCRDGWLRLVPPPPADDEPIPDRPGVITHRLRRKHQEKHGGIKLIASERRSMLRARRQSLARAKLQAAGRLAE